MIDQHNSLSEKFLKKGFWLYLFTFIIAPIGYIIKIIISDTLTVSEVGILYGVISLIVLVSSFNDFGMTESLKHFIPRFITEKRYDKVKSILTYALLAQIITGILIGLFFIFGADYIAINYFNNIEASNILKIFSLFFIGTNLFHIVSTFLLSIQDTYYSKILELGRMSFTLLSVLYVFFMDISSVVYYSVAWVGGLYLGILVAFLVFYFKYYNTYLRKEKIIREKELFMTVFKYAIWILLGAQAATILGQMDMQMIIYLLGTTQAGYYTNYLSIIGIPFLLIGPIFGLLFPIFSEMHSKGETDKIKLVKAIFQKNFLVVGIAINILFFIFSEIIAYILFGEKFIQSGVILKYSILFLTFNFLLQINFNVMAGIGKIKQRVKIVSIALVFNFILNVILIQSIGVVGAALATGIGWILIWVLSEWYLRDKYYVKFDYIFLMKNIIIMGLLGFVFYEYIIQLLYGLGRVQSFGYMVIVSLIWFFIFALINLKEFKTFYGEIKKLKKG